MIVHSFDRFDEVSYFDPATGALTPAGPSSDSAAHAVQGHYGSLGGRPVLLYRDSGNLLLRVEGLVVPIDGTASISHSRTDNGSVLLVADNRTGETVDRLEYALPDPVVAPEEDPTPFADPEDFDFGLFISNVANDAERRSIIYRGNEKPDTTADET